MDISSPLIVHLSRYIHTYVCLCVQIIGLLQNQILVNIECKANGGHIFCNVVQLKVTIPLSSISPLLKRSSLSFHLQEKMKEKVDMILKHNINCFINRQLIYNYPEQLFADAGVMAIEHADFEGVERLALVLGKFTGVCRVILRLDNCLEDILDVNIGVYRVILRDLY